MSCVLVNAARPDAGQPGLDPAERASIMEQVVQMLKESLQVARQPIVAEGDEAVTRLGDAAVALQHAVANLDAKLTAGVGAVAVGAGAAAAELSDVKSVLDTVSADLSLTYETQNQVASILKHASIETAGCLRCSETQPGMPAMVCLA